MVVLNVVKFLPAIIGAVLFAVTFTLPASGAEPISGTVFVSAPAAETVRTTYVPTEDFFEKNSPSYPDATFRSDGPPLSWSPIQYGKTATFHPVGKISNIPIIRIQYFVNGISSTVFATVGADHSIHPFFLVTGINTSGASADDVIAKITKNQIRIECAQRGVGGSRRFSTFSIRNGRIAFVKEWTEKGRFD